MSNKRDVKRNRKRLKVRFGVDYPKRVAFTEDLSCGGMFIITGQPERPGSIILLQITLPDDVEVIARGRVQWAKKVPPNLVRIAKKGGMGVRFTGFEAGEKEYRALIQSLRI